MIRTQLYLPAKTHQRLMHLAAGKNDSMANLVREFIEKGLEKQTTDTSGRAALQAIARLGFKGGPRDLSQNLDHYLYGGRKKRRQ